MVAAYAHGRGQENGGDGRVELRPETFAGDHYDVFDDLSSIARRPSTAAERSSHVPFGFDSATRRYSNRTSAE